MPDSMTDLVAILDRLYPQPTPPAADGPMATEWPHYLGLRERVMELGR